MIDRLSQQTIRPTHPKKRVPAGFSQGKKIILKQNSFSKRVVSIIILTLLLTVPFSSLASISSSIHPNQNGLTQSPGGTHPQNVGNCSKVLEKNLDENQSDKKKLGGALSNHQKNPVATKTDITIMNTSGTLASEQTSDDAPTALEGIAFASHVDPRATSVQITKAEHLDQNKTFLANITEAVIAQDGSWSEPVYHNEYVRVQFESPLTATSDITIVARSQGTSTIEVYTKDNTTLLTIFQNITTEDRYQVFLTNLTDNQLIFDLKTSGDPVAYDYIVDPTTGWISPTGYADPSNQWSTETNAYDENTGTYATHTGAAGWQGYLQLDYSSAIYCDRVRVYADFDTYYVDKVSLSIYNSSTWIEKYNGTITDGTWTELEFSGETNVTKARFRYHYIRGSVLFWFYEFDFWRGKPHTLPNGTTLNATSIDETTAVLKGNVTDDGGEPCEYRFQYGLNASYGTNTSWGGSEPQGAEFGAMIHNLTLGNTYQYRVQLRNDIGSINGSNKNFTTASPSLGWVSPISHYDPNSKWTNEVNVYEDETDTCTQSNHPMGTPQWSSYLYLNHSVLLCDKVRFYARGPTADAAKVDQVDLDVLRGGVWYDVYNGTFSDKQWVEKKFTQGSVPSARLRFHVNAANSGLYYELYEFDFNNSRPVPMLINEGPTNRSWGVTLRPLMNITVSNPDGTTMTISWSSNSSGSWQLFGTNGSVGNGTYHQRNNNFSSNNTKYWWKVLVTDGADLNSSWYYFSTPDLVKPSSNVNSITPYWKKGSSTITATASDAGWSGLKNVTLYYRYSGDNASWGSWVSAGVDSAAPWSWSFSYQNATGFYQFYSIAEDNASNTELPSGSADAWCGYETFLPSSSVSAVTSYWKTSAPLLLNGVASDTGPSGLKNVTLRYRYRTSNTSSWGGWATFSSVDTDPWVAVSWSFTFSNGSGHYEFYSIAYDNATNAEAAPGSADARCGFDNQAPTSTLGDGSISDSIGSTFEWNGAEGRHPAVIRLGSSEYFLIAAEGDLGGGGSTYDGWLYTIRVWSVNDTIQTSLINSWEYDNSDGFYPSVCLVNGSSNIYAITYEDAAGTARKVITTRVWSNNGTMQKTILDTLSLYRSTTTSYSKILNVNGNMYAVAYVNNSDGDGRLATCYITGSGDIGNAVNDTLEFNSSDALNPQMCLVDNDTIALVYDGGTAGGNDGYLVTYNISSSGDITNTWTDQWEFDTTRGTTPNIYKAWDDSETSGVNWFVIGYEDTNNDLYVKTCAIDDAGKITKSWVDTQALDTTNGDYCSFASVGYNGSYSAKLMLCGYSGEGSDGYVSSFDVTNAGAINAEIDTVEFDTENCLSRPWLVKTNATGVWMVVYEGTENDGWSGTFTVTMNGVPFWKTSSPFTIFGTGSDIGPTGLKNTTLWYRYRVANSSGWGGWVRWNDAGNPDVDPWVGISWNFTFPNGSGFYQFYSVAYDNVSNTESAPASADFWCGHDTQAPTSVVDDFSQRWASTSSVTVNVTATDVGSGVKNVALFYRFSLTNVSWGGWVNAGTDTASPWSWSFSFSNGTGYYQFYSMARDNLTYVESAPGSADTWCGYDTTAPGSSLDAITPYWKNAVATVTATANDTFSGVKNVTLYYRFSSDNASWGGWVSAGVDTAAPWSWSVSFSNASGYYQWYSRAKDNARNLEAAPGNADAWCGYEIFAPSSSIDVLSGYWKITSPLTITATASDTGISGLRNVTLYYRYRPANTSSWGGYTNFDSDVEPWSTCSWNFTFQNGSGHYEFYSIAVDNATNIETAPGITGDTECGFSNGVPFSQVNSIASYWTSLTSLDINATADANGPSGLRNVTLYYYHSPDNLTWAGPWMFGTDDDPWRACGWVFTFPNETGWYRLYSLAVANNSLQESAPLVNDTLCGFDDQRPTCTITYNRSATFFNSGDSLRINVGFSEMHSGINESSVLIRIETAGDGDLANHSMTMVDTTHAYYDWIIPGGSDDDGVFTVYIYASDRVQNLLSPYPSVDSSKEIDNTPPSISGVSVNYISLSSAVIEWVTNEVASSTVEYGLTSVYESSVATPGYVTAHSCHLTGLSSYHTYYFHVVSYDRAGNRNTSSEYTFVTYVDLPSTTMPDRGPNNPPSLPTIVGQITGHQGTVYTYTAQSNDLDNDTINYTFNWGDATIEYSGFLPNGTGCTKSHQWMNAGRYFLSVTASDNQSSSWSEAIIWIDALPLDDLGYLLDDDSDGLFDAFHCNASGNETLVEKRNEVYLIDADGNQVWDHEFNATSGILSIRQQFLASDEEPSLLHWLWVGGVLVLVFAVLIVLVYLRRFTRKSHRK